MTRSEHPELVEVTTHHVSCNGGNGPLGHPLVYLEIKTDKIVCPYCSRTFVLKHRHTG